MKGIIFSFFLIFLFTNCSSSLMIPEQNDFQTNLNKINYLGSSNSSKVFLLDNTVFNSSNLNISKDSLIFNNIENDSIYRISISQLSRIVIKDNTASIFGGLFTGLGSSTLAMLIATATECKSCHPNTGIFIVGALAGIVGYVYGYNATGEKEFLFNSTLH